MKRSVSIVLGGALLLGAGVWVLRPERTPTTPAPAVAPTTTSSASLPAPRVVAAPPLLPPLLGPGASLPALDDDRYAAQVARPASASLPRQESLPASPLAAFPSQGAVLLQLYSTQGGIPVAKQVHAQWRIDADGSVLLTRCDAAGAPLGVPVRAAVVAGRWTLLGAVDAVPAESAARLLDLARHTAALAAAFPAAGDLASASAGLALAGETWTPWRRDDDTLLLVAPTSDDPLTDAAPTAYPPPGRWNDLRIASSPTGAWRVAERLLAHAARPDEPGSQVLRIRWSWPAAANDPTSAAP